MKRLMTWLENAENNSESVDKWINETLPKLLWETANRFLTLSAWVMLVGTFNGIIFRSGSLDFLMLDLILFAFLLLALGATILKLVSPVTVGVENRIKEKWSYPVAFFIRIIVAILATLTVYFLILMPVTDKVTKVIELIGMTVIP